MRGSIGFVMVTLAAALTAATGCGSTTEGSGGSGGGTTTKTTTSSTTATTGSGGSGGEGGLPEGKCRKGLDCKGGEQCLPPGQQMSCGVCDNTPNECGGDAECTGKGPTSICEPLPCACSGQKRCTPGCSTTADCGPGKTCAADHRCSPTSCAQQLDCPTNFLCPPVALSHCERRTCSVDPECDVGYCVEGSCFDVPGSCLAPAP